MGATESHGVRQLTEIEGYESHWDLLCCKRTEAPTCRSRVSGQDCHDSDQELPREQP